jgi:hypothetical protein
MVGLFNAVYVKEHLVKQVTEISRSKETVGRIMGLTGDKGIIFIRFKYLNKSFVFAGNHFDSRSLEDRIIHFDILHNSVVKAVNTY